MWVCVAKRLFSDIVFGVVFSHFLQMKGVHYDRSCTTGCHFKMISSYQSVEF